MTEKQPSQIPEDKRLEASVAAGRITPAEAEVIRSFFIKVASENWPANGLQRRMQDSGG